MALTLVLAAAGAAAQEAGPAAGLRDRVLTLVRDSGAEVAVAFGTLDGRASLLINEDTVFHAASTMKVPVMVELFRQAAAGTVSLDDRVPVVNEFRSVVDGSPYTLAVSDDSDPAMYTAVGQERTYRELCDAMITVSSNLATNVLIDRLGADRVAAAMQRYGAAGMVVRRGVEDGKAFAAGLNNTATARGYFAILAAIGRGEAVSPEASARMVRILARQAFRRGIPAGLPAGIEVAHKTGTITRIHHDGGIVLAPRPYVLVVLTRGFDDEQASDRLIAAISAAIYDSVK